MLEITAIQPQKRDPERVNIFLDGKFAFGLMAVLAAPLRVGQRLDTDRIADLQQSDQVEAACRQAVHYLGIRARSESELRLYLHKRKFEDAIVNAVVARLRGTYLPDDSQFAQTWIENRNTFRPRSRRLLSVELRRKGIADEVADAALATLDEPSLAHQAALKASRRYGALPWADFRRRLTGYLARRGFESAVITPIVSRLWSETHPGQSQPDNEDNP